MTRRWRLALFGAGALVYLAILAAVGLDSLLASLTSAGWHLLPVLGIYGVAYACYNLAWLQLLADEPRRPGFLASYAITTAAFGINYLTPIVNAGGEPYRAAATAAWTGRRRATGATVLYYLLHALSSFILWIAALLAGLLILPTSAWRIPGILALLAGVLGLAALVLSAHRHGPLERLLDLAHRFRPLRRPSRWLGQHRDSLAAMDHQIREFWHQRPGRFATALGLDCLGRAIQVLEYWFICRAVGIDISYTDALFIGGLAALALNLFFFMPFELGSKEGSLIGLFLALGHPATLAVYASVVSRLRELVWIGIGLAMVWWRGDAPRDAIAAAASGLEGVGAPEATGDA